MFVAARAVNLLEQIIQWRMLDVQLERLADIALTPAEPRIDEPGSGGEIAGGIADSDVKAPTIPRNRRPGIPMN